MQHHAIRAIVGLSWGQLRPLRRVLGQGGRDALQIQNLLNRFCAAQLLNASTYAFGNAFELWKVDSNMLRIGNK